MYYYARIVDMSSMLVSKESSLVTRSEVASWVEKNLPTNGGYEVRIYVSDTQ